MNARSAAGLLCALLAATHALAQDSNGLTTIAAKTAGMQHISGFLDLHWEDATGKLFLAVPADTGELLYSTALTSGLGSNPVGLDRGMLGSSHVVTFARSGARVLLTAANTRYRADSDNPAERQAVVDSFAPSVIWGFELAATPDADGRLLVDATDFLLRDALGVTQRLQRSDQGSFSRDATRSALFADGAHAFPDNVEIEATVTFTSSQPGGLVTATAADAGAVTLRQHHSFVRLPAGYRPRVHDPRVGYGTVTFADYATPIDAPLQRRWIRRHRLEKIDPDAALSDPVEPIVYHLDPGAPEPIRSALREGALWWNAAFEAAGFRNAFRVEDLPAGADPLDVRYNMIHWVHRRTRGWSYGGSVTDPRTGEILKGNVLLGSLRVRQDLALLQGLQASDNGCGAGAAPSGDYLLPTGAREDRIELALARLRQLAAHEVGHTLGLTHNFAASTYDDRASVMDYPAPRVAIDENGALTFAGAYGVGVGSYDVWAIRYGYTQFAGDHAEQQAALRALVDEGATRNRFISDQHARAPGTSHLFASLWDNGTDPVTALDLTMRVRARGMEQFGLNNADPGEPLAMLEETLVPLYLHHRYQVEATAKVLGGRDFAYGLAAGALPSGWTASGADHQRRALDALLAGLDPAALTVPERILTLIPPHPPGYGGEGFARRTGAPLDPIAMATTAANVVLSAMLHRQRAARLVQQHIADPERPGLAEVLASTLDRTWRAAAPDTPALRAARRAVETAVVDHLMALASDTAAAPDVRALAQQSLSELASARGLPTRSDPVDEAHVAATLRDVRYFLAHPDRPTPRPNAPKTPPGAPIGVGRR